MRMNQKKFFTNEHKIFTNKKGLKKFSLMIKLEKKILIGYHQQEEILINKNKYMQINSP